MDKKTIIAFALSFVVLVGWSFFFGPTKDQVPTEQKTASQGTLKDQPVQSVPAQTPQKIPGASSDSSVQAALAPVSRADEKEITVDTPLYKAVFSNVGPTIKSFKLKEYRQTIAADSPLIDLATFKDGMGRYLITGFQNQTASEPLNLVFHADRDVIRLDPASSPAKLIFQAQTEEGIVLVQTFRFYPDQYRIDLKVDVTNRTATPLTGSFAASLMAMPPETKSSYYSYDGFAVLLDDKLEETELEDVNEEKTVSGKLGWVAYEDNFFISAVVPEVAEKGTFKARKLSSGALKGLYLLPPVTIDPLGLQSAQYEYYLGPRDLGIMKKFGKNLEQAINFGWTDIIAKPLLYILRFFYDYIHNYGVSIILLTILVKILFWPLTHKSYKSMNEMKKLQPMMTKIREKYKNDKQKMNQEIMGLYKTYKVNPMGGCLPMVIQIPVFFALFRVLGNCIELRHAPFVFWINDLSAPDRLFHFSFQVPFMTPPYGIPVLTLLMGASMFLQQKMTPTPGDPAQAKIMMFLPVIFTFMFINFPSGLVLYWLVNNLLSIGQQYRIHKSPA
ncbi:MAG TPA: membrane protein insertase YidC [Deltaproteobacteria bacterium]|nr:membrane protein insertase YidC [Deltaproteobacteria bacterium]